MIRILFNDKMNCRILGPSHIGFVFKVDYFYCMPVHPSGLNLGRFFPRPNGVGHGLNTTIHVIVLGHEKVGEVAVKTTEARLPPGSNQLYSGVQYNSTKPHQM
jgi:hypothetical protein